MNIQAVFSIAAIWEFVTLVNYINSSKIIIIPFLLDDNIDIYHVLCN